MSKTEIARQLSDAANEKRIAHLASQIETLRYTEQQNAQDLARLLEPLAQAMAALTDETRQTLVELERTSREQSDRFSQQLETSCQSYRNVAIDAQKAADRLNQAGQRLEWSHYALVVFTGLLTAMLVSVLWLWLAPPKVDNRLDPEAVATLLKPAVIEALKPSRNKSRR